METTSEGKRGAGKKRKTKNANANARKVKCLPQLFLQECRRNVELIWLNHICLKLRRKVDILAAITESPTMRNSLENKGISCERRSSSSS